MNFRIGDRVKLLSKTCGCESCDEARGSFLEIKRISTDSGGDILLENGMEFPIDWTWEVEPMLLENE